MPRRRRDSRHPPGRGARLRRTVTVAVYAPTDWGGVTRLRHCYLHHAQALVAQGDADWCTVRDFLPTLLEGEPSGFEEDEHVGVLLRPRSDPDSPVEVGDLRLWVDGYHPIAAAAFLVFDAYRSLLPTFCSYHTSGGPPPAPAPLGPYRSVDRSNEGVGHALAQY
jgi:hypothetical protein